MGVKCFLSSYDYLKELSVFQINDHTASTTLLLRKTNTCDVC